MKKNILYLFWAISILYVVSNFKRILGAFQSSIWSKEISLETHVANYTVHVQVVFILLLLGSLVLLWAFWKSIKISKFILWPLILIALVLFINTRIDFIRWIEINVFGAGALLFFTLLLIINLIWRILKPLKISSE